MWAVRRVGTDERCSLVHTHVAWQDGVVTWEEFQSAYTTNPQLIRVFAKLFGVDNAVDPAKEKYMSGPVFTITKAIASEQAAAFETARK